MIYGFVTLSNDCNEVNNFSYKRFDYQHNKLFTSRGPVFMPTYITQTDQTTDHINIKQVYNFTDILFLITVLNLLPLASSLLKVL